MVLALKITSTPQAEDLEVLGASLAAFNQSDVGPSERQALAVLVRDVDGDVVAGLSGYTAWGWLYVQWLWVAEDQRGRKLAGRLLELAEAEARGRGCHGAYIDTFNPQALKTYQRSGYTAFGSLPDFPKGRTRSFLSKTL